MGAATDVKQDIAQAEAAPTDVPPADAAQPADAVDASPTVPVAALEGEAASADVAPADVTPADASQAAAAAAATAPADAQVVSPAAHLAEETMPSVVVEEVPVRSACICMPSL